MDKERQREHCLLITKEEFLESWSISTHKSQLDAVAIMENFIVLNDVKVCVYYTDSLLWEFLLVFCRKL
jgi:hypothetical protein